LPRVRRPSRPTPRVEEPVKVRIQKARQRWVVTVPGSEWLPMITHTTWPEALDAALELWERLNCEVAT
jgi:hypothetical protein